MIFNLELQCFCAANTNSFAANKIREREIFFLRGEETQNFIGLSPGGHRHGALEYAQCQERWQSGRMRLT